MKDYYDMLKDILQQLHDANDIYCQTIESGHESYDAWALVHELKNLLVATVEDMLDDVDRACAGQQEQNYQD